MSDRFKFRAWNKAENMYHYNAECAYDSMGGTPPLMDDSFGGVLCNDDYVVEQCTGLTDNNGKLIYEGDYIRFEWTFKDNEVFKVVWDRKHCQFTCYDAVSGCEFITWYTAFENGSSYRCEIIGNIHEMEVPQ